MMLEEKVGVSFTSCYQIIMSIRVVKLRTLIFKKRKSCFPLFSGCSRNFCVFVKKTEINEKNAVIIIFHPLVLQINYKFMTLTVILNL